MNTRSLVALALLAVALLASASQAQTQPPPLVNLTTVGATIADGDKRCPDQPYELSETEANTCWR